ncbi:unnamed protein product, partial [Laminaria digitata]
PCVERVHLAPPPVVGPNAEGGGNGAGAAVPAAEAAEASRGSAPPPAAAPAAGVEATEGLNLAMPSLEENAAGVPLMGRVHLAPSLVAVPHAEGGNGGAVAAVPLAQAVQPSRGSGPLAEAAGPAAIPLLAPVVASHADGQEVDADSAVPPAGAIEASNVSAPHDSAPHGSTPRGPAPLAAAAGLAANPILPPVVATHAGGGEDDTGAAVPPARAVEASNDSASPGSLLPVAGPPVAAEAANEPIPNLEEINGCVESLFRPFPRSPAEVMANHMADTLRTPRCPPPGVARLLAGQA